MHFFRRPCSFDYYFCLSGASFLSDSRSFVSFLAIIFLFVTPCEGQTGGKSASIQYKDESPRAAVERSIREIKAVGSLDPFVDNADCFPGSPQWEQVRWDQVQQKELPGALPGTGQRTAEGCREFFRNLVANPSRLARLVNLDELASEVARARGDRVDSVMAKFDSADHYALLEKELRGFAELMKKGEFSVTSETIQGDSATVGLKFKLGDKTGETTFLLRRIEGRWYLNNFS